MYAMLKNGCRYFTKYFLMYYNITSISLLTSLTKLTCTALVCEERHQFALEIQKVVLQSVPEALSVKPCDYKTDIVLAVRKSFISLLGLRESDRYLPAVSVSCLHGLQHWFPARLSVC